MNITVYRKPADSLKGVFVMDSHVFELMQSARRKEELAVISGMNQKTERFGLLLKEEEINELVTYRNDSLKQFRRFEWGTGMLEKLIYTFCDSQYINQQNYLESLERLQDIFYKFKNATLDRMTDDEVLTFMKEQYETVCFGSLDYLEDTCLEVYAEAVRKGHKGYTASGGRGEYSEFDEARRWDSELYQQVLKELCWE
ncbi:hypothetical protein A8806_1153 [Faecalicatena orotica]|uniref:Uncharacterized protein n=2 Tax=Faecalicatena orotica TaxID=1544 RepID=A0A2Y9BLM3_9FIRM|nr:hypothetical protein A8806_1153 [Faecalicatena orotica]SSA57805.1 hypothetical protein SAMN05216536_1153 [Faecalicatena orotica]